MNVRFGAAITAADVAQAKADHLDSRRQQREISIRAQVAFAIAEDTWEGSQAKAAYVRKKQAQYEGAAQKKTKYLEEKYKEITGKEWVG